MCQHPRDARSAAACRDDSPILRDSFSGAGSVSAFSLIELLIVVALILILSTLYFGPNTSGKQQALKRVCQKNLEKIFVSMEIYANEHGGRFPEKPGARNSE